MANLLFVVSLCKTHLYNTRNMKQTKEIKQKVLKGNKKSISKQNQNQSNTFTHWSKIIVNNGFLRAYFLQCFQESS